MKRIEKEVLKWLNEAWEFVVEDDTETQYSIMIHKARAELFSQGERAYYAQQLDKLLADKLPEFGDYFMVKRMYTQTQEGVFVDMARNLALYWEYFGEEERMEIPLEFCRFYEHFALFYNGAHPQASTQQKKRGRPTSTLRDKIIKPTKEEKEELINKIRKVIKNNPNGRVLALAVRVCVEAGVMLQPTASEVITEFGVNLSKSGYNQARNKQFSQDEIKGMKTALEL